MWGINRKKRRTLRASEVPTSTPQQTQRTREVYTEETTEYVSGNRGGYGYGAGYGYDNAGAVSIGLDGDLNVGLGGGLTYDVNDGDVGFQVAPGLAIDPFDDHDQDQGDFDGLDSSSDYASNWDGGGGDFGSDNSGGGGDF